MAGMCWSRPNAESLQSRKSKVAGMDRWLIHMASCHLLPHRLSWGNQNQVQNNQTFIMLLSVLGGFIYLYQRSAWPQAEGQIATEEHESHLRMAGRDTLSSTLSCTGIIEKKIARSSSLWFYKILLCVTAVSWKKNNHHLYSVLLYNLRHCILFNWFGYCNTQCALCTFDLGNTFYIN